MSSSAERAARATPVWRRRAPRLRAGLAALVAAGLIVASAAAASARELRIYAFHAELLVTPDASLLVTETISVEFIGSWQGLYRTIPVEYPGSAGFNYSLFLSDVSATDGDEALSVGQSRHGGNIELKIYVPGATNASRTIVLQYRVRNALRFFDNHDELYWNVTGTEWAVPINSASARVTLPEGVTGLRATSFTGAYGARGGGGRVTLNPSSVFVTASRLDYREGLTIVVGWDKGLVSEPSWWAAAMIFLAGNWPLLLPLLAFALMFAVWYARGRDPNVGAVVVEYEPPPGLTPAEVGTLIDDSIDMRDITATIVDLAVRGYLTIEEESDPDGEGGFSFHLRKERTEWGDVKLHERLLLSGLFTSNPVSTNSLENRFYRHLPGIRDAVFGQLLKGGYFTYRPDRIRRVFTIAGVVVGGLLFGAGQIAATQWGMQVQPFLIAAVLTGAIICGFGWFMPARTVAGAQARRTVLGFEDFISRVESDRMERIEQTPETFEKYLPFAMALGVEKAWANAFAAICRTPPSWYHGPAGSDFNPTTFGHRMNLMSSSVGSAMTSAPRSSSSSSGFSSGGGFSGGGFGGGGGGGF